MKDNRTFKLEGISTNMADIDEAFREICKNFKENIPKARAYTKGQQSINMRSLLLLCKQFDCKLIVDHAMDTFEVYFQPEGIPPIENPTVKEEEKEEEEVKEEPTQYEEVKLQEVPDDNEEKDDNNLF